MPARLEIDPDELAEHNDPEPSRPRGILFVLGCVGVAAVLGGFAYAGYRVLGRVHGGETVPLIHADTRPVKVAPNTPGGMVVPDQDMMVLNPDHADDPRVEQLLPPPETPLPRPAPPPAQPAAAAESAPAAAMSVPPTGTPQTTVTVAVPPSPAPAHPGAAPAPEPPAKPAVAPAPAANVSGGWRLQLAAVRSQDEAGREWARIKHTYADLLGSLNYTTVRADLGSKGIFYRIVAGPIADGAQAARVCETLKQRKLGCILVKP